MRPRKTDNEEITNTGLIFSSPTNNIPYIKNKAISKIKALKW
jgi:hypothetical protein